MWGKIVITVMLIYRHWVIMAYSKKLSDTGLIALGKWKADHKNITFTLA